MKTGICSVVVLIGVMSFLAAAAAVPESNSRLASLAFFMGSTAGAAASENIAGSIDSDPIDSPDVMVAQVNSNRQAATQPEHVLGICDVAYTGEAGLSPEV